MQAGGVEWGGSASRGGSVCILVQHLENISTFCLFVHRLRYAGIFGHPLEHVLCLHQRLVADQRASAAVVHRWRPTLRQEAARDRMRPQHP